LRKEGSMKHKSAIAVLLLLCLSLGGLAAQDQPDIAYRILSGYIDKKEANSGMGLKTGGSIVMGLGGLIVAGAATTYFAGDDIARSAGAPAGLDPDIKIGLSIGLGVGGLVLSSVGYGMAFSKPRDYRLEYAEVFHEDDRQIREAMAVAVLRDLSIKAKNARVTSALSSFLVPVLSAAIRAGVNLSNGKEWSDGVMSSISWSAWSIAGGITGLFGSSEEERLYAKYLSGREALYGASGPKN
jgi:hypothetical protein